VAAIIAADSDAVVSANTIADNDQISFSSANGSPLVISGENLFTQTTSKIIDVDTKDTLVDADAVIISDSSDSSPKKTTWENFKTNVWSALGPLISSGTSKGTVVDGDAIAISDSSSSGATKKTSFINMWSNYFKGKADAVYQPLSTLLSAITALGNGTGFLTNDGSGGLSWGTVSVDPWAYQPVGVPIPLKDHLTGTTPPANGSTYTYIKLTAGLTGSGAFNENLLSSESVSGSSPTITATAVVALASSPIYGQTIRLLNTEGRFIRGSTSSGTLQDSDNIAHTHTGTTGNESADHTHSGTTGTVSSDHAHYYTFTDDANNGPGNNPNSSDAGGSARNLWGSGISANHVHGFTTGGRSSAHTHSFTSNSTGGSESRPRNIGITYYMRIK
jgi:hypothetical protein